MPRETEVCPSCGHPCSLPPTATAADLHDISPKSFGTAVALCGVFGILGIHHFYLGNILHGIADFLLCVVALACFASHEPSFVLIGMFLLLVDISHTVWVMIRLFTGNTRDGHGKLVVYPGQI
ncbi:NINE protein [Thalassospira marina]|nr:TM2 domain-containing protein [Thalassospira marina]